jgi:phenylacetic acid degradation operon negative regulatory protein
MIDTPHQRIFDDLIALGELKVWSVLMTILGDQARKKGQYLPGPAVSRITTRLAIRPEAHRVALHRLRKDGWIDVTKNGRISQYALSEFGRAETQAVQDRIYAPDVERPSHCTLILTAPEMETPVPSNWIKISERSFLTDQTSSDLPDTLQSQLKIADIPDWARRAVLSDKTTQDYAELHAVLTRHTVQWDTLSQPDQLALRIVILHRWRRLVLSHGRDAAHLMGAEWPGNACRREVHKWLSQPLHP